MTSAKYAADQLLVRSTKNDYIKKLIKFRVPRERCKMIAVRALLIAIAIIVSGCAHHQKLPPEKVHIIYLTGGEEGEILDRYAPVFLTYDFRKDYNRIGRPSARFDEQGEEIIYVDATKPVVYYLKQEFSTEHGNYTNLVYRIHFPKVPFSIIPFNITGGRNVGVIVVITLDSKQRPVLVTTVGTCGCYVAIVPTTYLPPESLPENWQKTSLEVYGEKLPSLLDYGAKEHPKLLVHLRPGVHRVMNLEIVGLKDLSNPQGFAAVQAPLEPVSDLERIPLDGKTTSFYYDFGPQKGHVKLSMKIWETLLLSLVSWDFFVGMDKVYGDNEEYENPFYTSLKPWNREVSDMSDFAGFLQFWGWRL
jgi:hypothetical protein